MTDTSTKRIIAVVGCFLTSLGCGTLYVYSAYAPQLAEQLNLTTTESSLIGEMGTLGIALLGILSGFIVDRTQPQVPIALGAFFIFGGYYTIYYCYVNLIRNIPLLCIATSLAGFGSALSFMASIKASALNFPKSRGTATAFPLSAFGLCAFLFSLLSNLFFHGNTAGFLRLMAIMTSSMCLLGSLLVRVHENPQAIESLEEYSNSRESNESAISGYASFDQIKRNGSFVIRTNLLPASRKPSVFRSASSAMLSSLKTKKSFPNNNASGIMAPNFCPQYEESTPLVSSGIGSIDHQNPGCNAKMKPTKLYDAESRPLVLSHDLATFEVAGFQLLKTKEFWLLFSIIGITAGAGQMYIYCVGFCIKALITFNYPEMTSADMQHYQTFHVSLISICSFSGRFISGILSDVAVKKYSVQRMWLPFVSSALALVGFIFVLFVDQIDELWAASMLVGLAYGVLFGCYPTIVGEFFGSTINFSQNWATVSSSPVITAYLSTLMFGKIYDSNINSGLDDKKANVCYLGKLCYIKAFKIGIAVIIATMLLILYVIYRHYLFIKNELEEEKEHQRALEVDT
ncbi:MFS general substrate transporter [Nadsonia fulvescens var. elongata DSM 6958]|uniref:MFS general substrate transporter n=1 Tax=Nadsonia fulvescens var. elongata DSM 6958 TaxID=857566 RepID=A0A1E3PEC1_9ASCO|nr:MFS general substrate transporter [Nadsonia fulvescens var. elongata DSM 6958]